MTARAFTVATLADAWECSPGVIRKLIGEGRLGHFRIGALIRIPAEEVRRFECQQNTLSSDSEAGSPSSIGTTEESGTASDYEPRIVLGQKRRRGAGGLQEATVYRGPWGE